MNIGRKIGKCCVSLLGQQNGCVTGYWPADNLCEVLLPNITVIYAQRK
jgi:hypothetical protein